MMTEPGRSPRHTARISIILAIGSVALLAQVGKPTFAKDLAPSVYSPPRAVDRMLELARLRPSDTVYDLGAGDGRIVITAAQKYGVHAVGIEMKDKLVKSANDQIARMGLQDKARLVQADLLKTDLAPADVVIIFLQTTSNEELRPRLEKYLKPGARVVSYAFPVPGWKPVRVDRTDEHAGHNIYVYEMPPTKN